MESGVPNLVVSGKRRREGYSIDEDLKDVKTSRQWYGSQRADDDVNEGFQNNVHYPGISMESLMRMQQIQQHQQQQQISEAAVMSLVVPHLNMQQRVEAAAALQDLRGNVAFQQPQLQHMKYGIQQQQQSISQIQKPVTKPDVSSLGDSNYQPQSPLPLPPPPYIRTPPLHSEADVHNGSPTSSSSGPYPNLPNLTGPPRTSQQCSAPIQLLEPESDSSYSSLMHISQSNLLAQSKAKNVQSGPLQTQQSLQSSQSGMSTQQLRGHSPQSGMAQQVDGVSGLHSTGHDLEVEMSRQQAGQAVPNSGLQASGSHGVSTCTQGSLQNGNVHYQNGHGSPGLLQSGGVAFHHNGHTSSANGLQIGVPNTSIQQPGGHLLPNQLPQLAGASLLPQGRHSMPSSLHHQQGVNSAQNGVPNGSHNGMVHQQAVHSAPNGLPNASHNGMMHQQSGHRIQDGMLHSTGHISSMGPQNPGQNSAVIHQSVQGSSSGMQQQQQQQQHMVYPPLHRDIQQTPNNWYPSIRDTTTISETQPSVSTSRLQTKVEAVAYSMNSPMLSFANQLGSKSGLPTALPQVNQVQNGYRDIMLDQDLKQEVCGSPSNMMGKVLPAQTDLQGRRFLQGNNFSAPSSSGGDINLSSTVMSGAFDDPRLLQRAFLSPQPKITRSYIKVYKLGSITRAVDVNRFKDYTELRCELARMFNLDGQLDPTVGWQLVFTDNEDDLLLVGDDPWDEFVRNVRGIRILTPAEVYFYTNEEKCTAAAYNSTGGSAPKPM